MTTVRPFEAEILRLLHAVFGRGPVDRAVREALDSRPRPKCLGREALGLIEDTLARGCVRKLARRDNWRRKRHLRGDRVVEGSLWERFPVGDLSLTFSGGSLEFLIRLVADAVEGWPSHGGPALKRPTTGDSLLFYFVYEAFRGTKVGEVFLKMPFFQEQGLCRLAFPIDFAEAPGLPAPDLAHWVEPARAWVVESLQGFLADAWLASEAEKRAVTGPARMVAIAREQGRVAEALFSALESAGRRDLARFVLRASRELLARGPGLAWWTGSLELKGLRLADRAEVFRAALATLATLERPERWEREARDVGYFDDGYAAAQLWKSDWARFGGEEMRESARALFRAADPLASAN